MSQTALVSELQLRLLDLTNNKDLTDKQLSTMTNKTTVLDEEVQGLRVSLEASHLEISAVKKHASEIESDLTVKTNELIAITTQNTELIAASAAKDQEIESSLAQTDKDRTTIVALTTNLTDLEAALKRAIDELANKTNDMTVATTLAEKQTATLKAQTIADSENNAHLKNQIVDLQTSFATTAVGLKACTVAKSEVEEQLVSFLAKSKKDDEDLAAGRDKISTLEAALAKSNRELSDLTTQVANLVSTAKKEEKKRSALTSQTQMDAAVLQSLRKHVVELTASVATASSDTSELKASLLSTSDMLDASAKQVSALTADQVKGNEERAALQSSIEALKDVNEAQRNHIAELQSLLTQKEQLLAELDKKMINVRAGSLDVLIDHTGTGRAAKVHPQSTHPVIIALSS